MKNIKLLSMLGLIISCTPNVNNTNPNKTNNPSSKTTDFSSIDQNIITPKPSPSINNQIPSYIKTSGIVRRIYSSDDNIIFLDNVGTYRMLINEKKKFLAEIYIDGILYNDIVFESSNPNLLSIDSNGVATTFSGTGEAIIKAHLKNNPSINTLLKIQILETLLTTKTEYDKDCNTIYVQYTLNRADNNFLPNRDIGMSLDISGSATFNGKVFDPNGVPVDGVKINANTFSCGTNDSIKNNWIEEAQITRIDGSYVFRNAPAGGRIRITITKDGWTTRSRNVILKSNLQGDPLANVFDFSTIYAIQDEPEIVSLKVNGQQILKSSKGDEFDIKANSPKNSKPTYSQMDNNSELSNIGNIPELTGINSNNLEVEMVFNEPIKVEDIRDYFRITSQSGFDNRIPNFTIDENSSGVTFIVSEDEKTITFKTNKAILSNKDSQEARYLIDFSKSFRDKTDKTALDRRYVRFSPTQINDFAVFSVKNDENNPKLISIIAKDGGSSNDTILLRYSEPMELINLASYSAGLSDPLEPSHLARQLWYRDANLFHANNNSIPNSINDNNATLVGFLNNSDTDINQFRASYMIGRILKTDIQKETPKISILGSVDRNTNIVPISGNNSKNDLLKNARITGSNVLLEFSPDAFNKDDTIVLSVGKEIKGSYNNSIINENLSVNSLNNPQFTEISDPAGRLIDSDNPEILNNIEVNNSQKVTIVQ
jgi:hypothetical protein